MVFRYKIMWERLESLALEIKEAWCSAPNREGLGGIAKALVHVQRALRSWSNENFGAVTKELEGLRDRLETLRADPQAGRTDIPNLTDRMDELLYHEEMMWLQRSRIAWLREGVGGTTPNTHGKLHGLRPQGWSSPQDEALRSSSLLGAPRETPGRYPKLL